jgi:hypothetical protein
MINLQTTSHSTGQHHLLFVASDSKITAREIKRYTGATSARKLRYEGGLRITTKINPFRAIPIAYQHSCLVTGDMERFAAKVFVLSGSPTSPMLFLTQYVNDIYARVVFDRQVAIAFIKLVAVGFEIVEMRRMFQQALQKSDKSNVITNFCQRHGWMYPTLAPTTESDISSIGQVELDYYASKIRGMLAPSW